MFKAIHFFIFIVSLVGLWACSSPDYTRQRQLLVMDKGEEAALYEFEREIRKNPKEPENYAQAARLYLSLGQLDQARTRITKALLLSNQNAGYRFIAGRVELAAEDYFQAITHLSAALELDNRLLEGHFLLAQAFERTGKTKEALKSLNTALQLEPLYFEAGLAKVKIEFQHAKNTQNFPRLAQEMEDFLKIQPRSIQGNLLLTEIYRRMGATLKARLILEEWLKRFRPHPQILYSLAELDLEAGYPEEARASLKLIAQPDSKTQLLLLRLETNLRPPELLRKAQALVAQNPQEPKLWIFLGQMQAKQGQLKKSERSYQKALSLNPSSGAAYLNLSKLYRLQGDPTGAKWAMNKALELEPTQLNYQLIYLEGLLEEGNWLVAKEALEGFKLDANHPQVVFFQARIAQAQGDLAKAKTLYQRAQRLWGSFLVDLRLAEIALLQGELHQAEQILNKLAQAAKGNLEVTLMKARLRFAQGNYKAVLPLLLPWKRAEKGKGRVQVYLAEAQARRGKKTAALRTLKLGLSLWPGNPDLIDALTHQLGMLGRFNEALPYLEDIAGRKHPLARMFHQRLLLYYQQAGYPEKAAQTKPLLP